MSELLRVLQVEDSPSDAALTERFLTKAGYDVHSERVVNAAEMLAALAKQPWDIILADQTHQRPSQLTPSSSTATSPRKPRNHTPHRC